MLRIEFALVLLSLLVAFIYPSAGRLSLEEVERGLASVASRKTLSVILVGVAALITRAALLPISPIPEAVIGDEFGYLLQADTFAHGRLTNPTHPMWVHFETFNVIQKPTYQCYMQPAQGMVLAAGKLIAGHPFWGVWFSVGLMCAAICWMLQGWVPPEWALLGGIIAILRFGTFDYWANGYMGGAVAATGGSLVLGALPRIQREQKVVDALVMGIGLAILAANRSYEGFVFSLPVAVGLLAWMLGKKRPPARVALRQILVPLGLVLAVAALALGYYFWRVTGSPFRMPYQVEQQTYGVAPYFIWQAPRPQPLFRHDVIKELYAGLYLRIYALSRSPLGVLAKMYWIWQFYFWPSLTLPILLALALLPYGFSWKQIPPPTRFLLIALSVSLAGLSVETFFGDHYAAPLTCILLALVLLALRRVRVWQWHGKPAGLFIARAVPVICLGMFLVRCFAQPLHISLPQSPQPAWFEARSPEFGRSAILSELRQIPGNQLVIVHYSPGHPLIHEWVYNDADIDAAKVVWAHDMGAAENRELLNYFLNRQAWLLDADAMPPKLGPYSEPESSANGLADRNLR